MSIATLPLALAHVSLDEWDEDYSQREDAYELVDGIPTVAADESFANVDATMLLADKLGAVVRPMWRPLAHFAIRLGGADGTDTIRQPDLAVVRRDVARTRHRVEPADVALVVLTGQVGRVSVTTRCDVT